MKPILQRRLVAVGCAGWCALVILGLSRLWQYEGDAGIAAAAPLNWPAETSLVRSTQGPTLLVFAHPHCPCSRATIGELAKLMTRCQGKLMATVLLLHPDNMPQGWEKTDLWQSAEAIPGVAVVNDDQGRESYRFGAATSGQVVLYSADGRLLFSGGITESRGHSGDNAGRSAVELLALETVRPGSAAAHTPVYGCGLFSSADMLRAGLQTCQK